MRNKSQSQSSQWGGGGRGCYLVGKYFMLRECTQKCLHFSVVWRLCCWCKQATNNNNNI